MTWAEGTSQLVWDQRTCRRNKTPALPLEQRGRWAVGGKPQIAPRSPLGSLSSPAVEGGSGQPPERTGGLRRASWGHVWQLAAFSHHPVRGQGAEATSIGPEP